MFEALARLRVQRPDVRLHLMGDCSGSPQWVAELDRQATRLGISAAIVHYAPGMSPAVFFANIDVLAAPSRFRRAAQCGSGGHGSRRVGGRRRRGRHRDGSGRHRKDCSRRRCGGADSRAGNRARGRRFTTFPRLGRPRTCSARVLTGSSQPDGTSTGTTGCWRQPAHAAPGWPGDGRGGRCWSPSTPWTPVAPNKQVQVWVRELRRQGVPVEVACLRSGGRVADRLQAEGVTVHELGKCRRLDPLFLWRQHRLLARRRPAAVLSAAHHRGAVDGSWRPSGRRAARAVLDAGHRR